MKKPSFMLINSPLLGRLTWSLVAGQLSEQGYQVFEHELIDDAQSALPFWKQEVENFDLVLKATDSETLMVGHSGAGALLPMLGQKLKINGYIFVDAVLLFEPASRLEMLAAENAEMAQAFEGHLRAGGHFPNWGDEQLQALIPDADLRQRLLTDVRPRTLPFFTERIEPPNDWDKSPLPCGYIRLSDSYTYYASQAEARGWPVLRRDSHHFAMLTEPSEIATMLIEIGQKLLD